MLRRIYGSEREKVTGDGANFIMSFSICTVL
jgi:hypothetical protein